MDSSKNKCGFFKRVAVKDLISNNPAFFKDFFLPRNNEGFFRFFFKGHFEQ